MHQSVERFEVCTMGWRVCVSVCACVRAFACSCVCVCVCDSV